MNAPLSSLLASHGPLVTMAAAGLSVAFILLFSLRYIRSNTEHRLRTKLFDIIAMFFYIALCLCYILAGISLSGHPAIGICAGLAAFWAMLTLKNYMQRKRVERAKQKKQDALDKVKQRGK